MTLLRLGTRKSALAQAQARWVADRLRSVFPDLQLELVLITTTGDKQRSVPSPARGEGVIAKGGLKALFTKEIEEALLDERIDLAVHSLKDMAAELPPGLALAAIPEREDPRDAWISKNKTRFKDLPPRARIATGAVRRQAQLRRIRPDLELLSLRGNVDIRLKKLAEGDYDGLVLALAGLKRLGREQAATEILSEDLMLPAIGQGALAIETRAGDARVEELTKVLNHLPSQQAVLAERAFLKTLGGNCQTPIAARAQVFGDRLTITGLAAHPSGQPCLRAQDEGRASEAETIGRRLARQLLAAGADKIL